jgi:uncharacterized Zn finger protein
MHLIVDRTCPKCRRITQAKITSGEHGVVFECQKCGTVDVWHRDGPPTKPEAEPVKEATEC